jgi:hypothetical protein
MSKSLYDLKMDVEENRRLMAIDEGKTGGDSSPGFTGGVNSYYYFQNMKYVK